jgi:hypothetical protein
MIKIIEKEVKIVKEYDVEPKVVTLYYANELNKDIVEYKNCIFKEATPVVWNANECLLKYENGTLFRNVIIDIKTGIVKDYSEYFFDYEQAVSIHKKLRIEFLRDRIDGLKEYQKELKKHQQELEELENDK